MYSMIPLAVLFSAVLGGFALGMAAVALLLRNSPVRRGLSTPFCLLSLCMAGFALGQTFRNACPDVATADLVARWAGFCISLLCIAVIGLFRALTSPVRWRFDAALITVFAVFACVSLFSPGGINFATIDRIELLDVGSWGPITAMRGQPDELLLPLQAAMLLMIGRLVAMVLAAKLERLDRAVLLVATALQLLPVVHGYGLVCGWWNGIPLGEYTLSAMYVVLGLTLWHRERELARDIQHRRQQVDAVLEHGLGLSGLLDRDGRLLLANRTALAAAGVEADSVIGRNFADTPWWSHSADARRRLNEAIARAAAGQADRFATTHPLPDGSVADVDFSLTPYRGTDGQVEYLIAEGRDISELKRYDRIVRESSKMDAVGQLAGGVAHDFNNVLGGIMGAAELALMRNRDETIRQYLETIISASSRAGDLTRRLLAFARKGKVQERALSANESVRDALELFTRTGGTDLRIEQDLRASPDVVLGDPTEIQSALLNLCINARDAMPAGGRLRLATSRQQLAQGLTDAVGHSVPSGWYIRIDVIDQGSGIAPDVLARIFEPFFTTKAEGRGTGLGLPAVLGTAHAHGGGILLSTAVGQGTTVSLLLPASDVDLTDGRMPAATGRAHGELVVLVDDEPSIRWQARELLISLGFRVEDFGDPLVARERLRSIDGVHAVILDLAMPGLNGRDLYQMLRTEHPDLPIIISSGYAGGGQVLGGATDPHLMFMPKPWRINQLCEILKRLNVLPDQPG